MIRPLVAFLLCAPISVAAIAVEIPFAEPEDVSSVVAGPRDAAIVDWNSDGRLDLLVAPFDGTNPLRYYRNESFGWVASNLGPAVLNPSSVETGDIDGDGTPDVLYTSSGDDHLRVILNRPSAFLVTLDNAIDNSLMAILADFDGDGDLDAAATSFGGGQVYWYENDTGTGESWTRFAVGTPGAGPRDLDAADLDGDGDLDLAVVTFARVVWYENRIADALPWSLHDVEPSLPAGWTLDTGDLDRDGDIDIVAGAVNTPALSWWENPGSGVGTWTEHPIVTTSVADVELRDLDLDADLDLVVARFVGAPDGDVRWYENDGLAGGFTLRSIATGYDIPRAVALGDLDGDGDDDVVIAGGGSDRVDVAENVTVHGTTKFDQPNVVLPGTAQNTIASAWGDFDRDGDTDLVTFEADQRVRWRDDLGSNAVQIQALSQDLNDPRAFAVADLDGDGDLDIVLAMAIGVEWLENSGSPGVWARHTISNKDSIDGLWIADVNGDGRLDIIGLDSDPAEVRWWRQTNVGGWFDNFVSNYSTFGALTTGDVDLDGELEIVIARDGAVVVYQRIADTAWNQDTVGTATATAVDLGDFDGDGDLDIAAAHTLPNSLRLFQNLRSSGWSGPTTLSAPEPARNLIARDIDRDGTTDILVDTAPAGVRMFFGHGDGTTFTARTAAFPARDLALLDWNRDGWADLAGSGSTPRAATKPNSGGQVEVQFISQTPAVVTEGAFTQLAKLWGGHLGRPGDSSIDLTSLRVRFTSAGLPLPPADVAAVFGSLSVWRQTGPSPTLDPNTDVLLGALDPLVPNAAEVTIPFTTTGSIRTVVAPPTPHVTPRATLYLAADIKPGAAATLTDFDIELIPADTIPLAVDESDVRLKEWIPYFEFQHVTIIPSDIFADGFESGSTSAWSATVP